VKEGEKMLSHEELAAIFKAMSDEPRLKILDMLCDGEMCACDILEEFAFTQPTLSYHMKTLAECGLVKARKDGAWMRYSLNMESVDSLRNFLNHLSASRQDGTGSGRSICK
jgi:ArsR family transcriptional regulator